MEQKINYGIIAAGEGSRLAQEGIALPKPLTRLNGQPMLGRLIDIFVRNNAASISLIMNEEMRLVHEYAARLRPGVPFNVVIKSTPSSMHSFYELRNFFRSGKFCLTTVDTIFKEADFSAYIREFMKNDAFDGLMGVTGFIDDEKPLYVDADEQLNISGFRDKSDSCRYVSGGIYGLTPKAIDTLERCIASGQSRMRNYQRQLVADGLKLKAYVFPKIIDVDHAEDIEKAEKFINGNA